jgi:hypothetical protein
MREPELSPGAAAACGRLDAFVRVARSDLGRWMIQIAERLAAEGRSRRSLEDPERREPDRESGT